MDTRSVPEPAQLSFQNFAPASLAQWKLLAGAVLARSGGRPAGDSSDVDPIHALSTVTDDGIAVRPLYVAGPGAAPALKSAVRAGSVGGWDVRALHRDPDAMRTNAAVLVDLQSGVASIWLAVGDNGTPVADLPIALDGVYLDLAPIVLDAGARTVEAATALIALADQQEVDRGQLSGSFGADPIAARARSGGPADLSQLGLLAVLGAGSAMRVATVDGTVYNDAGGSDSDELAATASAGVAYLRALRAAGVADPFAALEFRYAVGDDQFTAIAKLRAARVIWSRIGQLCGVTAEQRQHAVTSAAMMTRRDPWVNILRSTIGCFSAAVAGAHAITVRPFDAALGLPDDLARRLARNTQAVIHDEAHLGRVIDPAGGSWYVEAATEQLAGVAWDKFTALERAGGALAALDSGLLGEMLATSAAARSARIDTRARPITGVTAFADLDERSLHRSQTPATSGGRLPVLRYAQAFEALRDRADSVSAADGKRPTITLATFGPAAAYAARVGFARELFAVAGIESVVLNLDDVNFDDVHFDEVDLDGQQRRGDVGPVVCLCASDALYAQRAVDAVSALRAAGVTRVMVAGRPDDTVGADAFVYVGVDALSVLGDTLDAMAVPA